jgi:hypothetical protein
VSEREITAPVDLCLPDGHLNPDAVGWSRRPLHTPNLRGWGRAKRWEYWGILTPTHMIGVTVSSLDYAGLESLYVLDRQTREEVAVDAVVPLARGVVLPERSGAGRAHASADGLTIDVDETADGTRIRAVRGEVTVDVVAARPGGHECLAVVVPWSRRRFQYTVKDVGRPASGVLNLGGERVVIDPSTAYAVLDHGRGKWPYAISWNWSASHGVVDGHVIDLQLGGRWTDGTGSTENAVVVDGVVHKSGADLRWRYHDRDWLRPWHIEGPGIDVTFHPEHVREATTNMLVVANRTHQCFGRFEGAVTADDGTQVRVDGLDGWAEEAANRW